MPGSLTNVWLLNLSVAFNPLVLGQLPRSSNPMTVNAQDLHLSLGDQTLSLLPTLQKVNSPPLQGECENLRVWTAPVSPTLFLHTYSHSLSPNLPPQDLEKEESYLCSQSVLSLVLSRSLCSPKAPPPSFVLFSSRKAGSTPASSLLLSQPVSYPSRLLTQTFLKIHVLVQLSLSHISLLNSL